MSSPLRLWRMMRHVPLSQLAARARLQVQRRVEVSFPTLRLRGRGASMEPSPSPPLPIFEERKGKIDLGPDHVLFRFLGTEEMFARPIDWRPARYQKGTRLWLLNLHYMEYLEELNDRDCLQLMVEWVKHTPPFQAGFWRDNWNSYSLSIRVVVWMQQLAKRRAVSSAPPEIMNSLRQQLLFLDRHLETDIGGNHLIKNIKALIWGGRFFDGEEAARLFAKGESLLRRELRRQILDDGMHYELTPAYHRQVFADLLEIRTVIVDEDLKKDLDRVLDSMADALVRLLHPDGELAQFGDTALDSEYDPEILLAMWSRFRGWKRPADGAWDLQASGFAGIRTADFYLIVRAGRMAANELPAHGHGDVGAFEISGSGRRMIVDAGVYEYDPGRRRDWSRSTQAHNTVTVADADQAEFWGSFRVGRRPQVVRSCSMGDGTLEATVTHDGFAWMEGKPVHRRMVTASSGSVKVADEVTANAGGYQVRARLLLHPDVTLRSDGGKLMLVRENSIVALETDAKVSTRTVEWFPRFGEALETTQIVLEYGPAPTSGSFTLRVAQ